MHLRAKCGKGKARRCSVLHDSLRTLEDVSCPPSCCHQLNMRLGVVLRGEQAAIATGKDSKEGWGRLSGVKIPCSILQTGFCAYNLPLPCGRASAAEDQRVQD